VKCNFQCALFPLHGSVAIRCFFSWQRDCAGQNHPATASLSEQARQPPVWWINAKQHSPMQRNSFSLIGICFLLCLSLTSCEIIGNIFEAGVWTGVIAILLVIGLIIWLIGRLFGRSRN
jgi:hypothetical protein